jgi:hypothetical protein
MRLISPTYVPSDPTPNIRRSDVDRWYVCLLYMDLFCFFGHNVWCPLSCGIFSGVAWDSNNRLIGLLSAWNQRCTIELFCDYVVWGPYAFVCLYLLFMALFCCKATYSEFWRYLAMQFVLEGLTVNSSWYCISLSNHVIRNNNVSSAKSVHQEYMEHYVAHLFQSVTSVTDSDILQVD